MTRITRITRTVTSRTFVVLAVCCVAAPVASAKSVPSWTLYAQQRPASAHQIVSGVAPDQRAAKTSAHANQIVSGVAPDQRAPQTSAGSQYVLSGVSPDTRALASTTQHVASNSIAAEQRAMHAAELAQRPGVPASQAPDFGGRLQAPAEPGNGFDWGDAGIGALVIAALALLALGGTMVPRVRNQRSSRTPLAG